MTEQEMEVFKQELMRDEGVRFVVYDDATGDPIMKGSTVIGHPTIGVGRNLAGKGLDADEVRMMLRNDILTVEKEAGKLPYWSKLNDVRKRVVMNMMFNMGPKRFSEFFKMRKCLIAEDWEGAAREMKDSKWYGDVGERAVRLVQMMKDGRAGK